MEFRDRGDEVRGCGWMKFGRPIGSDTFVQVYEPLASNVIADDQNGYGQTLNSAGENVIHISVPRTGRVSIRMDQVKSAQKRTSPLFGDCLHQVA